MTEIILNKINDILNSRQNLMTKMILHNNNDRNNSRQENNDKKYTRQMIVQLKEMTILVFISQNVFH